MLGGHLDLVEHGHAPSGYTTSTADADVAPTLSPDAFCAVPLVDALHLLIATLRPTGGNPFGDRLGVGLKALRDAWRLGRCLAEPTIFSRHTGSIAGLGLIQTNAKYNHT